MRTVLQRADGASVAVSGEVVGAFDGAGVVALVGVHRDDTETDAEVTARKIADLRLLDDDKSVSDTGAPILVISQFTLYGNTKRGRRPSWSHAAPGDVAEPLVQRVVDLLRERGLMVHTGIFGADMRVSFTNSGPFTLIVDS